MSYAPLRHLKKVLIANRGEIAVRCIKACAELSVNSVAIFTNADATSQHVTLADEAFLLPGPDGSAYTDGDAILEICKRCNADAVIPGYGFLSENTDFAASIQAQGMVFVGPSIQSIRAMGLKHEAREIAVATKVPVISGSPLLASAKDALKLAREIGFPVMLKATGGGGGMGLQICQTEEEVEGAFARVESRSSSLFKNSGVFLEKYYPSSRHIEVQVVGNGEIVVAFGERECSLQRRHQKVIEECPSPFVERTPGLRSKLLNAAVNYASYLKYKSVGTVEFLVDNESASFFFLEMNTRLQVEHGITEMCYEVDLVHLMLRQADYEKGGLGGIPSEKLLSLNKSEPSGSAIEVRVYAEIPSRDFAPSPGLLQNVSWPETEGVRVDTWVKSGQNILPYYDPLIAKLMVHSKDGRAKAQEKMIEAISGTLLQGTPTNLDYCANILATKEFTDGNTLTSFLGRFKYEPNALEVITPGVLTSVQDYPGRLLIGHGVPKSGPMDDLSSRVANALVGNDPKTELLEITLLGPELLFHTAAVVSICGGEAPVTVDGEHQPMWSRLIVGKGQRLKIGNVEKSGLRCYIAIKGGLPNVPLYLGSKSTATELGFGGTQGRKLQPQDLLDLSPESSTWASELKFFTLDAALHPNLSNKIVYCMEGPYDSADIITDQDRETIYTTKWKVSHNSNRSGVRLQGPKLQWARPDGGEGGTHPSNLVEYGYPSPGGLNWTGDDPIIFTVDSPDLGGFACSTTMCSGDLWKVGQLRPGDEVQFRRTTYEKAVELLLAKKRYIDAIARVADGKLIPVPSYELEMGEATTPAILKFVRRHDGRPNVCYRQGGERFIIVKYGEEKIDLRVTARIRLLQEQLLSTEVGGFVCFANAGTMTVQYDCIRISQADVVQLLCRIDDSIEDTTNAKIRCREVMLPTCMDHPVLAEAQKRYMETIRPTACYLPDNLEYVAKNNALKSRREAFEALLGPQWLTVAVGFFVGTPMQFPLDPKYRMVAQKYNPTRTYTPGGTIGFGGSMVGLYPVASPGGYQILGRTLETWNSQGTNPGFTPSKPWLFEPFDIIKYFEVSVEEYDLLEREFLAGRYTFDIREAMFDVAYYHNLFDTAARDPAYIDLQKRRHAAMLEQMVIESKLLKEWNNSQAAEATSHQGNLGLELARSDADVEFVAPASASVWKILVKPGDVIVGGQVVAILEAMKMEIQIVASEDQAESVVVAIGSPPGTIVAPGASIVLARSAR